MGVRTRLIVLLTMTLMAGCEGRKGKAAATARAETAKVEKAASAEAPPPVPPPMAEAPPAAAPVPDGPTYVPPAAAHFFVVNQLRKHLVTGDLDAFRKSAEGLAKLPVPPTTEAAAGTAVKGMTKAFKDGAKVNELAKAALLATTVAADCGACHQAVGHQPTAKLDRPPPDTHSKAITRFRHQWAAETMWLGLVGPSDLLWTAGAEELARSVLAPDAAERPVPQAVLDQASLVHDLAERAKIAPVEQRRALLAEYYSACAACHDALRTPQTNDENPSP